ncbi:MAG TPA: GspE/PulE family protein [Bacteroidota bacterium]|nr:GspE/PulE family protein [Bacteroidota bacterium]
MLDEFKNIAGKVQLEQFDVANFSKEKIRELFRTGKVPTAEVLIDELILRAIKEGATDLHLEPHENELRIRLGFEGFMKRLIFLPKEISENLANVLKTKATLNAFEKKKPQEGQFSLSIGTYQFDIRISLIPVLWGEQIALRIFQKNARSYRIEEIGFSKENLEKTRSLIRKPSGLLLFSGPVSGGKTTTMYSTVNDVATPEKNIISVENPIESKLEFASQISVSTDKTFTFADALRAILKQNPNIIMLSEVRDTETGSVVAEAALTGNLVVSTMLANDAIGTVYRLLNLGVLPYWLASSLNGIVYQQLVRKICESCKEEYQPTAEELSVLGDSVPQQIKFYRGKGCDQCEKTGYKGRTGVHEIFVIDDQARELIYQQASIVKLKAAAFMSGFETIAQDAIKKLSAGITTIQECSRAVR